MHSVSRTLNKPFLKNTLYIDTAFIAIFNSHVYATLTILLIQYNVFIFA